MQKLYIRSLLVTTALLGCGVSVPALAQNAAATTDDSATIIVTARRVEERLQDVPISITVFNQQQLSNGNVVNSQDLARLTPSLSANSNFGSENSSFAIRGFVQDTGTAPSVGVYFADVVAPRGASNGIPAGDGAGAGSFFDLQNVQVLKGPQGTLFGRNTTGGAVLLVPQKPTPKLEGYVEGSVGNYDMRRIQAVVNVPVGDSFRVRLGIDRQTRDGFLHNTSGVGPTDMGDVDYTAFRGSFVADLSPNLENYTLISYSHSSNNSFAQKIIAAAPTGLGNFALAQLADQAAKGEGFYDMRQDLPDPHSKLEQWQVINTTTWRASDTLTLKNIVSYAQLREHLRSPLFGTAFSSPAIPALGLPSFPFGFASINPLPGHSTANQSTFTEEFQVQGSALDDRLTYQAGAYLEISRPLDVVGSQSPVVLSCTNPDTFQCTDILSFLGYLGNPAGGLIPAGAINITAGRTRFHDVGIYTQATYKFTDQLKLTGGIRYTWDRSTNDSFQQSVIVAPPRNAAFMPQPNAVLFSFCTNPLSTPNGCNSHFDQRSSAPTWLIDLDYTPTPDILIYAKYSRGYRAGTIAPNVTAPYNIVRPEKVDTYEAGLKASFHGAVRGTFNVAGFYNDFSDQQLQLGFDPAPGVAVAPTAAPVNAGKSRIYGVEVEASITPFTGLTLEGGYTYLNTRIKEIPVFGVPTGSLYVVDGAQRVGDRLALSPKNKFTITGTYTLPLDESVGRISFGATYTHTDSQVSNYADRNSPFVAFAGLGTLPATDLLNVNFNWHSIGGKPVDLSLFATNVTKEKYYAFVPGLALATGFETAVLGEPRMYGVRLKYRSGS